MQALILASESPYRAALLSRLGLTFSTISPGINEERLHGEAPKALATRLAAQKAEAARHTLAASDITTPSAQTSLNVHAPTKAVPSVTEELRPASRADASTLIIASDQVAACGDNVLGKPLTMDNARAQLASMSGQTVDFYTALDILHLQTGVHYTALDTTRVTLRLLDELTIERYLDLEKPLDCAGSFKVEALGISLFDAVTSEDPTALIGLPLISVCKGLRHFGWSVPPAETA